MSAPGHRLQLQFASLAQQTHAARLGMWLFLASEVLLFSALFTLYAGYRVAHPEAFSAAGKHTDFWLGALMTVLLITSSLAVALAVGEMRAGRARACLVRLGIAVALGLLFLVVKGVEWTGHFREGIYPGTAYRFAALPERGANVFFTLYYLMTGLHALHVIAGLTFLVVVARSVHLRRYDREYQTPLELGGMYWHLVDGIWIFLWPLFYLLR